MVTLFAQQLPAHAPVQPVCNVLCTLTTGGNATTATDISSLIVNLSLSIFWCGSSAGSSCQQRAVLEQFHQQQR